VLICFYNKVNFHNTLITPKRVTSLQCPSPRHSAKATQLSCLDDEAVTNRLQCCTV